MPHRRREVSRVEGFSDAVFGFAVTLLVVSLEVPKTFDEMLLMMRGFPAFAASFATLFMIWWRHYRFFRRYDLEDTTVITLTGFLLFVILFYVYPLKFVWSTLFVQLMGGRLGADVLTREQVPMLFEIYGVGAAAAYGLLAAMYWHAYRHRTALDLTPLEIIDTRIDILSNLSLALIGLLSAGSAVLFARWAPNMAGLAGLVYFLIGFSEWALGTYQGRLKKRVSAR